MAGRAGNDGVLAGQWKSGDGVIGEGRVAPLDFCHRVALRAVRGEVRRDMTGIRRGLICLQVATDTLGGEPRVLPCRMARFAVHRSMQSGQRKARLLMALCHLPLVAPLLRRVTLGAGISKLTAVDIEVTPLAVGRSLAEVEIGMTGGTLYLRMPANERKTRGLMTERGRCLDGPPAFRRMAIAASKRQRAVRTAAGTSLSVRRAG